MRPLYLTISAFGSYAKKEEIDFTKLSPEGLYLVTGDTGAGKTTLFDGISFGLFGKASGSTRDDPKRFRNSSAGPEDETYVELTFENKGVIYVVRRNPVYERASKRKNDSGVTKQIAKATLEKVTPEGRETLANSPEAVTKKICEILGVNHEQFVKMAMLAQGEFQKLLIASASVKKEIFTQLFSTEKYDTIAKKISEDFSVIDNNIKLYNKEINDNKTKIVVSDENLEEFNRIVEEKEVNISEIIDLIEKQIEIDEHDDLDNKSRKSFINSKKEALIKKIEIEKKRRETEASIANKESIYSQKNQEVESKKQVLNKSKELQPEIDKKASEITTISNTLGDYEPLEAASKNITANQAKLSSENKALDELVSKHANMVNQFEKDNAEVLKLPGMISKKAELEKQSTDIKELIEDLALVEKSCKEYVQVVKDHQNALVKYNEASTTAKKAELEYIEMNNRFLDEQAGILAKDKLKENMPCPVCGSIHHPNPAVLSKDAPSEADIKIAKQNSDKLSTQREELSGNVKVLLGKKNDKYAELQNDISFLLEKCNITGSTADSIIAKLPEAYTVIFAESEANAKKNAEALRKEEENLVSEIRRIEEIKANLDAQKEKIAKDEKTIDSSKELIKNLEMAIKADEATCKQISEKLKYASKAEAENLIKKLTDDKLSLEKVIRNAEEEYKVSVEAEKTLQGEIKSLKDTISNVQAEKLDLLISERSTIDEQEAIVDANNKAISTRLAINNSIKTSLIDIQKKMAVDESKYGWMKSLSDTVRGQLTAKDKIDLESFVQAEYFDRILENANLRFEEMSEGHYSLLRTSERENDKLLSALDISVEDHNDGSVRNARTLSGGESFIASLALALGLADEVTANSGGVQLDSLFVDEGFGSLDEDTLDTAVRVLSQLSGGHRQVGIISHIAELVDRVEHRINVTKDDAGISHTEII